MNLGDPVCKYGRTTGYTCGTIETKQFDPDGSGTLFNATFIYVDGGSVNLSEGEDSGGPWFYGTTAYGVHKGGSGNDAWFMAQNYMSALNIRVKIV